MPEQIENNPLSQEIARHLHTIALRGPIRRTDQHHGAVHGTSLETIQLALNTGVLIGHTNSSKIPLWLQKQGSLSVYPTPQLADKIGHLTDPSIQEQLEEFPEEAIRCAKIYAEKTAKRHAFVTSRGRNLFDPVDQANATSFLEVYNREALIKRLPTSGPYSQEELRTAYNAADSRHGFLLGISPEVANMPGITLQNGDLGSSDICIDTNGKGLPYLLISGIEPLGPVEEAFLQSLS